LLLIKQPLKKIVALVDALSKALIKESALLTKIYNRRHAALKVIEKRLVASISAHRK